MNLHIKEFIDLIPKDQICAETNFNANTSLGQSSDNTITSITIDSRKAGAGSAFFAFEGEHTDGHDFILQSFENGTRICIGTKLYSELSQPQGKTAKTEDVAEPALYIQVKDTLFTLQQIARNYREIYLNQTNIIGVTGSVGKTTTKDMLCSALSDLHPIATKGNLNNHIGVPLSVLEINPDTKVAILEAGMNHRGETKILAEIMQPNIVVITHIGVAHIEFLGTREEIAREKADLALFSPKIKSLYIPKSDEYADFIESILPASITCVQTEPDTIHKISLTVPGKPMLDNAVLALEVCKAFNIDIQKAIRNIEEATITPRRLEMHYFPNNNCIIDDSYNANPDSMKAGLDVCDTYIQDIQKPYTKRIAILGGMGELGENSDNFHKEIATYAFGKTHIDEIYSVGALAEKYQIDDQLEKIKSEKVVGHFRDIATCIDSVFSSDSLHDTLIFIKGSKSTNMSNLADILIEKLEHTVE